ncbi:MAG TPA: serine hydrolase domain-containing protein [Blastocatellia bacterium]|nr:serine hydrolase domain-containing protein [Blastocatellia bacterium]
MSLRIRIAVGLFGTILVAFQSLPALRAASTLTSPVRAGLNNQGTIEERIRRVEQGLLTAIQVPGSANTHTLAERMRQLRVPAVSIAVINNGRIEWARAYGVIESGQPARAGTTTLFQAASISKPVAAMGALHLVELGRLALDEDVNKRLISWKVPENDKTKDQKVTLRRLLSHSAGLTVHGFPGYAKGDPVPIIVQVLDGEKPANTQPVRVDTVPGTIWRYSGGGISIAQLLMMDVTGEPFPRFMRESVLAPLGMTNSTYEQPLPEARRAQAASGHRPNGDVVQGKWHTYPEMAAAGLWTTPTDLCKFAIEIQKSRAGQSNRVLSPEMTSQMLLVQKGKWGLGIGVDGKGKNQEFSHGGSNEGFRCQLVAYTELGMGAAVMTNSDTGGQIAEEILRAISAEYGWPSLKPVEKPASNVDPKTLKQFAGKYTLLNGPLEVTFVDSHLVLNAPHVGILDADLAPESDSSFLLTTMENITISFEKDSGGEVSEMVVKVGGQTFKGKRAK